MFAPVITIFFKRTSEASTIASWASVRYVNPLGPGDVWYQKPNPPINMARAKTENELGIFREVFAWKMLISLNVLYCTTNPGKISEVVKTLNVYPGVKVMTPKDFGLNIDVDENETTLSG